MDKLISKASTLIEALPYLQKYRGKTFVFKYGGHAMQDPALRESFLQDIILLQHVGIRPLIVHGGGPQIKKTLADLGVESKFANGLRITDEKTMEVVEMVLVGKVNGQLVNLIHKLNGVAVGFSGTDGNMILAEKLPIQKIKDEQGEREVDFGFVGRVKKINPHLLNSMLERERFIPIVSPIGITAEGVSLNINADTAACEIAKALHAEKLILLTDVEGVLGKDKKLIPQVGVKEVKGLVDNQVIQGGMIPKIESAVDAVEHGVGSVTIINGQVQHAVLLEIFTDKGVGTLIS